MKYVLAILLSAVSLTAFSKENTQPPKQTEPDNQQAIIIGSAIGAAIGAALTPILIDYSKQLLKTNHNE